MRERYAHEPPGDDIVSALGKVAFTIADSSKHMTYLMIADAFCSESQRYSHTGLGGALLFEEDRLKAQNFSAALDYFFSGY